MHLHPAGPQNPTKHILRRPMRLGCLITMPDICDISGYQTFLDDYVSVKPISWVFSLLGLRTYLCAKTPRTVDKKMSFSAHLYTLLNILFEYRPPGAQTIMNPSFTTRKSCGIRLFYPFWQCSRSSVEDVRNLIPKMFSIRF